MILRSDIDRVLDVARIEDVVEEDLTRYGKNLRCCCPFHTEKTPSFVVFPARNSYKCFGCGKYGHPVDYLMEKHGYSFPQAIKQLADRYKITLTEEEETPEEKAKRRDEDNRRQLMINTYQRVQQFFVRNIREDNPEALAALSYATKRWGVDFVDAYGIGYAYNDFHKLKDWAKEQHLSEQILIELGLLAESEDKSHTYDFFRGRIMIPIRSASQLIIAYTARYVPASKGSTPKGDKEPPKYLNSKNSLLYSKDKSVFGLDVARQYGASEDKFYLMEGGPDVLRLQYLEINNAVASLGSDWTEHQLQQLQRYAHTLCFIPDIDPPKAGEKYGTGIKKVMKFGEKCLAMGFDKVLVKEITSSDKSKSTKGKKPEKMDADSYFQTKNKFDMVSEENFIVWYAAKLSAMHGDDTEHNVSEVARLLSYVKTEYQVNIIIDEITPYIKATKKTWTDAITNAKCNLTKDLIRQKRDKDIDGEQLEQYGFIEKNHCYVTVGEKGKTYEWSNFVLKPLFHIKDATASSRIFKITNMYGTSEVIELKQEDLASRVKFATKVESLGNFLWLAKDEQLTSLKRYLYKATDTAYLIHKLGWQKRTLFYAFGNGIFDGAVWHAADEYGIVKLNEGTLEQRNYYLPSASTIRDDSEKSESDFEHQFIHTTYGSFSMEEYISRLVDSFGDNAKVAYAFLLATVFRDVIVDHTKMFPILNIFGVKGTGKSELGHSLMAFFIINNKAVNILNSTIAALSEAVAQCSNALVHIDEYKNIIDVTKIEFLKGLWDGTGRTRMTMDKDKKRETTQVDAGVILSGQEMPNKDIALFSRLIFLRTVKTNEQRTPEERRRFQNLVELRKQGCSHLLLDILKHRPQFIANYKLSAQVAAQDLYEAVKDKNIEDRLFNNWLVPLAAFHAMRNIIRVSYSYEDLLSITAKMLVEQNNLTKDGSEVAAFWNIVDFLFREGHITETGDFKIEWLTELRIKDNDETSKVIKFDAPKEILFLRHRRIFELYQMHGRQSGEELVSKKSIAYYLRSDSTIFYGLSTTKRFTVFSDGTMQQVAVNRTRKDGTTETRYCPKEITDQAYCFDYKAVQTLYGINLKVASLTETSDEIDDHGSSSPQQGSIDLATDEGD